ncbi:MAG: tryptophan-rich sensory protein [Candidatus Aenigmarchaeota archaeon]|nr:tryptophan-rich sensory protein [Candidatus Aenigmarchaeota archaeon]
MKNVTKLIISIVICEVIGLIGSVFTIPSIGSWYTGLQKPGFTPPNWAFAPVWTTLFLLMGISLYFLVEKGIRRGVRTGLVIFGAQLALNLIWSILFFGLHNIFFALVEIVVLWIVILVTIICFWRIRRVAGYLLVPYICWVTVAALLNYYIWILNP